MGVPTGVSAPSSLAPEIFSTWMVVDVGPSIFCVLYMCHPLSMVATKVMTASVDEVSLMEAVTLTGFMNCAKETKNEKVKMKNRMNLFIFIRFLFLVNNAKRQWLHDIRCLLH